MATQKQIAANRKNAVKSTGPRTPEGKIAAGRNRLQNRRLLCDVVLPQEDNDDFLHLLADLRSGLQPVGVIEEYFVRQLAIAAWRLKRLDRIETGLLCHRFEDTRDREFEPGAALDYDDVTLLLGIAFHRSAFETLPKLARWESAVRRSFYRAWRELRRLQRRRPSAGQPSPAPPAEAAAEPRPEGVVVQKNSGDEVSWP